ncbi:MAG TPA: nucleotidyltransferase [Alloiococcus sp.]|nr:nucleotidyltransferase [Alloiococcus sp.]
MKAVGIIAEYNPFHNGHKYQIEQARVQTNSDIVIVAMSGNFLQRGVPAMFDKWTRANWALQNGVDLVIELPTAFSTQAADYFALGGTKLLNELNIDTLVFGVESGTASDYKNAAEWFIDHESELRSKWTDQKRELPYSQVVDQFVQKNNKGFQVDLSEPNNMLGFTYAKQMLKHRLNFNILPIKRKSAHYHDEIVNYKSQYASATAIRKRIMHLEKITQYVPKSVNEAINELYPVSPGDFWPFIQYKVWNSLEDELKKIYEMDPGLEVKFKKAILNASSYEKFIGHIKSKHLTFNKINRLILYTLLDMTSSQIDEEMDNGLTYIRLLAMNQEGQTYLNNTKASMNIPLYANVTRNNQDKLALDIKAGELYRLINPEQILKQDFTRNPYQTIDNKAFNQYTE